MEPWLQELIAHGKETGAITYREFNAVAPGDMDPDRLMVVLDQILNEGITLIDDEEPEESLPAPAPLDASLLAEIESVDHLGQHYHRNADFERTLRAGGVPYSDAVTSFAANGAIFDAELIIPGEQALVAWLALRNLVPVTAMWPVIRGDIREAAFIREPEQLDPDRQLATWQQRWRSDRAAPRPELTPDMIRADAARNIAAAEKIPPTPWTFRRFRGQTLVLGPPDIPDDDREPPEPDFAELFSDAGPFRAHKQGGGHPDYPTFPFVRIRLYPTAVPWEVFAYSPFGGWTECPWPDEQLTMLRHWYSVCAVEVVSRCGDWYELFVPRPPRTRHQAHHRVDEMNHFGEETFYSYGNYTHPDPIEAIRTSHYWYFWWD